MGNKLDIELHTNNSTENSNNGILGEQMRKMYITRKSIGKRKQKSSNDYLEVVLSNRHIINTSYKCKPCNIIIIFPVVKKVKRNR